VSRANPDIRYMKLALREAMRGSGAASPNPRVGAVIVSQGRIIAKGFHKAFGLPHAEVECLKKLPEGVAREATLYVNLEPCCHQGKTPPCTEAIIQSGIRRLVYGLSDPNPLINGKGLQTLTAAGIELTGPVLEGEAREINRGYLKYRREAKPWVTLKWAQSLDGRIAASGGNSRWISGPQSLKLAHQLRAEHDAVLVGINTILTDNPQLTVRHVRGHNPRRVILDTQLRLQPDAAIFKAGKAPILVATRPYPPAKNVARLEKARAEIIWIPQIGKDELDLNALLDELIRRGILYLLVEGGSHVQASFVRQNLFDEIVLVQAPIFLGGDGIPAMGSLGVTKVAEGAELAVKNLHFIGRDIALTLKPAVKQDRE
jgi:diaminohydroxyphosphoribosylaminopyrimidine deaminase/5-amino-6-(5-phosphoribosylamino)uracil reductase